MTRMLIAAALAIVVAAPAFAAGEGDECGGATNAQCDSGLFCEYPAGTCGQATLAGTCVKVPEVCTEQVDEVCGCDNKTYSNDCKRQMASQSLRSEDACPK